MGEVVVGVEAILFGRLCFVSKLISFNEGKVVFLYKF